MAKTREDLLALLGDMESDQVERKESLRSGDVKDRIYQAICAFSNDLPDYRTSGVVFVGATDDGRPAGMVIDDRLLLDLADMRGQGRVPPPPTMYVTRLELGQQAVAVIEVEPSPSPPVRFDGQVWVRVGPRRALATAADEQRRAEKRRSGDRPFDSRPAVGSTRDDLDVDGFTPTEFVPGAYVQFIRVDGTDLAAPIVDERRLSESLPTVLRQLDELLKLNIRTAVTIGEQLRDTRKPDYPLAALQQLTRNAVLHRSYEATNSPVRITWYTDRVEINSPGGPFGSVTVENFGKPGVADYHNPVLAEAMANLGYVQRFGAGLPIVRSTLAANGNPPAEFTVDPSYFGVVLRTAVLRTAAA